MRAVTMTRLVTQKEEQQKSRRPNCQAAFAMKYAQRKPLHTFGMESRKKHRHRLAAISTIEIHRAGFGGGIDTFSVLQRADSTGCTVNGKQLLNLRRGRCGVFVMNTSKCHFNMHLSKPKRVIMIENVVFSCQGLPMSSPVSVDVLCSRPTVQ